MLYIFKIIFKIAIIFIVFLILLEFLFRILPYKIVGTLGPNKANIEYYDFGPWFVPNQKFSFTPATIPPCFFSYPITINSHGMRSKEVSLSNKNTNLYRIAVLGDSVSEGLQVNDEHLFTNILNKKLENVSIKNEVLNFGFSGYGTAQQLYLYEKKVKYFNPDLVLLFVTSSNDLRNNSMLLDYMAYGKKISEYGKNNVPPFSYIEYENNILTKYPNKRVNSKFKQNLKKYLLYRFYTIDFFYRFYMGNKQIFNIIKFNNSDDNNISKSNKIKNYNENLVNNKKEVINIKNELEKAKINTYEILSELNRQIKNNKSKLVIAIYNNDNEVTNFFISVADKIGIQNINFGPNDNSYFQNLLKQDNLEIDDTRFSCDAHPNEIGHKYIANILSNWLQKIILKK